jgi:hypothetical protein
MQQKEIMLRSEPLLDFPVQKVYRVKDFGAVAGDGKTCTEEIQAAIDEAIRSGGPSRIEFDPGVYRINVPQGRIALKIEKASKLIIDGNGCEFHITEPTKELLTIEGSERIIVKNLAVDFEVLPHTQGWVTAVDSEAGNLTVELDPAYPDLDSPHFHEAHYKWAFIKNKDNPVAFKEGTEFRLFLKRWHKVGENRYKLEVEHKIKLQTVEVGDPFVQISRIDGGLFLAHNSADVTFMDLRVFASSNAVFATGYCDRPNFIRVNATPRKGRWLTSGADGCFMFSGRGGPWVEDCRFEAIGDDNLIIKGFRAHCINIVDVYTFDLVHGAGRFNRPQPDFASYLTRDEHHNWQAQPGDTLTVMDPRERTIACRPVVTEVDELQYGVRIHVDRKIPNLRVGTDYEDALAFFNDDCCLSGFVVRNNVFKNAIRFGFLLKSHDGLVEGNHFEGNSDQAICMLNTYQEYNGIPYNLIIRKNIFKLISGWPVRTATTTQHTLNRNRNIFGVVTASVNWPVGQWDIEETGLREVRNLWIEDNQFINWWQNPAISVNNGLHVRISGNSFTLDEDFADTALTGTPIAVKIVNSTDVHVENNTLSRPGLNLEDGIKLIDSGAVIVRDNREI